MRGWLISFFMYVFILITCNAQTAETGSSALAQARQLKMEGTQLQLSGNLVEAVQKYRESLALHPDEKLADLIGKLENRAGIAAPDTFEKASPYVAVSDPTEPPTPMQNSVDPEPSQKTVAESPVQSLPQPVAIPEPVIPAAVAPPNIDDSYGQYRLVQKLSASLQGGVISASEKEVYINLGQVHGVPEGMQFEIVRPGEPIRVNGEIIGHKETKVAIVEATTVRDKLSICQAQEQEGVPQVGDKVYQLRKKLKRLVVGQFTYNQGVNQLTKDLQEKLVTAFASRGMQVVERDKLEKVLEELKLGYSGLVDMDSAKKIGELLGAEGIILGTISDMGNEISLNGRLVDISSGNTLSAGEVNLVKTPLVQQLLETKIEGEVARVGREKPSGVPGKASKNQQNFFENDLVRIEVVSLKRVGPSIELKLRHVNVTNKVIKIGLSNPEENAYLIDELGNQFPYKESSDFYRNNVSLPSGVPRVCTLYFKNIDGDNKNIIGSISYWSSAENRPFFASFKNLRIE